MYLLLNVRVVNMQDFVIIFDS